MINFIEYQNALDYAKKCFLQDLKELEINSAQIFGSSTYQDGFVEGVSDIDICIFTSKMYTMKYKDIVDYIYNNTKVNFIDKKPSIVIDYIADRIEFYIDHPQIAIDVTIMAPELPNSNNMEETVAHDAVDVFLGAFYKYGIPLIGEIPNKKIIEDNFFPFYSDDLRRKRLDILIPRVIKYNKRLEILIKERNYDILDHIYKARTYFLKWLFIYKRQYPVNMHKHLYYQLFKILELSEEEIKRILFIGENDIFNLAESYLKISNKYINDYRRNL